MQPRTVGLLVVLSLATGWLASSFVSDGAQPVPANLGSGPRPLGRQDTPAPLTQELHLKLQEHPRSPTPGRNPFIFGSRGGSARLTRSESAVVEPAVTAAAVEIAAPPRPRFALTGVALTRKEGVEVYTAILTDSGVLVLGNAGDRLPGGYSIVRVEETAVVIASADGVEQTLRLR